MLKSYCKYVQGCRERSEHVEEKNGRYFFLKTQWNLNRGESKTSIFELRK